MTEPTPISTSAIAARAAQKETRELIATLVQSEERFQESVDTAAFNPQAAARQQERLGRFRTLDSRMRSSESKEKKIEAVKKETETDDSLARNFSRRNPELDPDKLAKLKKELKEGDTPEHILREVESLFKDPTIADEAIDFLEQTSTGFLKESVQKARALLNEAKGSQIIAGRNIAPVVSAFHKRGLGENPTELRDLYRNITGNPREHNTLFTELANKYTFDNLKVVLAFLLKSLGYDLKSKGPSIQQAELIRLMTDMRNLQSILWVYLFFKSRMKMVRHLMAKSKLKSSKVLTFELLAKEFIKLVEERYPSVMKLLKQAEHMGLLDDEAKVIVLTQFRDAMRQLSLRLYKTPKARQDLLIVILETLQDLEAEEEEEED